MATVNNCNLPEDLHYLVERHVWCREEQGVVTVGMTDVAQNLAKTIIAVTPKKIGRAVTKGQSLATVESGKWVGPVPSPVDGEVLETNAAVVAAPATVNSDPYGEGWIVRLRASDWAADSSGLATGEDGIEAYRRFLDSEGITCEGG